MEICAPNTSLSNYRLDSKHYKPKDKELMEKYLNWRDEQLYVCGVTEDGKILWWKAAKRGTPSYIHRITSKIEKRISSHIDNHQDLNYWKFLTLTVEETEMESIKRFRRDWNRFLTNLRKRHPQMRIFKVYELQKRGSVHLHAIIWGIKWIPTDWLRRNWNGRHNIQRPRSIKGILHYLTKYLTAAFLDPYVQAFMWYYGMRQWACNFPCPVAYKTNSNLKVWGIGVCVLKGVPILWDSVKCNLTSFLRVNGLYNKAYAWTLKNIPNERGLSLSSGSGGGGGMGAYQQVANMLKYNWLSYRNQGLYA